jgi:formylglycine-generating enzyme required for sulfatase activity
LPAHTITISKPFLIGEFEITQKQWEAVMGKNPSAFKDENHPVDSVSWDEVQKFIEKLNDKNGARYRLPTEAEWEYCCRASSTNLFGSGTNDVTITSESLDDFAWFRKNSENRTHPIGEKKPNAWGLYDMHGNVWEWCQDWYASDYYAKAPEKDPLNTAPHRARLSGRELVSRLAKSSRGVPERKPARFQESVCWFPSRPRFGVITQSAIRG